MGRTDVPPLHDGGEPFLVAWEVTRASNFAAVPRRAGPTRDRDPRELTTEEGFLLIDQVRELGRPAARGLEPNGFLDVPPCLVLTGGDPLLRPDLVDIVRYATKAGLTVVVTLSDESKATRARLTELNDAGLSLMAVGLDAPDAETHDAVRGIRGSYARTIRLVAEAIELGLPLQINTTVSKITMPGLETLACSIVRWPLASWMLLFPIRSGRAGGAEQITGEECERVLNFVYDFSVNHSFDIRTTDAPQFQRIVSQREEASWTSGRPDGPTTARHHLHVRREPCDGNGCLFVDHVGNIGPSALLPARRGNVRNVDLLDVYQTDEFFVRLRNRNALVGKCRRCPFRLICGGSRSRAFASTGSLTASDPLCVYEPGPAMEPDRSSVAGDSPASRRNS